MKDGTRTTTYVPLTMSRAEIERHIAAGHPSPVKYEVHGGKLPIHLQRAERKYP